MGDYFPVPKREVSMLLSWGLKPLKRQMNVSLENRIFEHKPIFIIPTAD